jgi:hypothetical protein
MQSLSIGFFKKGLTVFSIKENVPFIETPMPYFLIDLAV